MTDYKDELDKLEEQQALNAPLKTRQAQREESISKLKAQLRGESEAITGGNGELPVTDAFYGLSARFMPTHSAVAVNVVVPSECCLDLNILTIEQIYAQVELYVSSTFDHWSDEYKISQISNATLGTETSVSRDTIEILSASFYEQVKYQRDNYGAFAPWLFDTPESSLKVIFIESTDDVFKEIAQLADPKFIKDKYDPRHLYVNTNRYDYYVLPPAEAKRNITPYRPSISQVRSIARTLRSEIFHGRSKRAAYETVLQVHISNVQLRDCDDIKRLIYSLYDQLIYQTLAGQYANY